MKKLLFSSIFVLAAFLNVGPVKAAVLTNDTLIKGASFDSVYYYADGKRYVFPNEKTYLTWYSDFNSVQIITDAELAVIPISANATYRPGARMIKIQTDPKVYAVDKGGILRWVTSEQTAKDLYGINWNKMIDDVPDYLFTNYKIGDPITSQSQFDVDSIKNEIKTIRENDNSQIVPTTVAPLSSTPLVDAPIILETQNVKLNMTLRSNDLWSQVNSIDRCAQSITSGGFLIDYPESIKPTIDWLLIKTLPDKQSLKISSLIVRNLGTANLTSSEIDIQTSGNNRIYSPESITFNEAKFIFDEPITVPSSGDLYIRLNTSKVLTGETVELIINELNIESSDPEKYSYNFDLPIKTDRALTKCDWK